jgi:hypothetical protein
VSGPWDLPPRPPYREPEAEPEGGCLIPLVVGALLAWGVVWIVARIFEAIGRIG